MGLLSRLHRDRRGVAMLELALALPLLLVLFIGGYDVVRLLVLNQKLDRLARAMADLATQGRSISTADLQQIYEVTDSVMWPFNFASSGRIVISGLKANGSNVKVTWQATGAGSFSAASRIGTQGGTAHLPSGFTLSGSETSVAAEAFFDFRPVFSSVPFIGVIVSPSLLYRTAFFPPRLAPLDSLG
jgi:Flp pilus assembly protein TadG